MKPEQSRAIWHRLEPINAVNYFCAETFQAFERLGFKGFWMGYFASRSAPMGQVSAATIEATFFNFHPARVRRAIPDAWVYATPDEVMKARADAAAASLRRLLGRAEAEEVASAVEPVLAQAVEHASAAGRPIFAGNREVDPGPDPVARLWQAATSLREQRGDGHVALLAGAGLDGLESVVLFSLSHQLDPALFTVRRGWSAGEWEQAGERLRSRGLVSADDGLSAQGVELRAEIERRTDELAAQAYEAIEEDELDAAVRQLGQAAVVIVDAGEIEFPNAMGLPSRPDN
jgi:hypothetical protein